jgi:hypothetical protein
LVIGMPSAKRRRKPLVVLVAFVDDSIDHSGDPDPVFVLGGYVAPEESWERFSDEWEERLPLVAPSKAFKMSELAARWGPDDERIMFFYRVIEQHVAGAFACIAPVKDVDAAFAKFPLKIEHPGIYALMFQAVIDWLCHPRVRTDCKLPLDAKVKFIFDTQMFEDKKIIAGWENQFANMPRHSRQLLDGMPQFESEEEFLPLQAADFYAWWARRHWKDYPDHRVSVNQNYRYPFPWKSHRSVPFFEVSWSEAEVTNALWAIAGVSGRAGAAFWATTSASARPPQSDASTT